MPLSTATVSMVHSVPELMVSSEVGVLGSRGWEGGPRGTPQSGWGVGAEGAGLFLSLSQVTTVHGWSV